MMRKAPSTAFKKGQSGNPRGRPKRDAEVSELARVHTMEALETLASVMRDAKAPASARVSAASAILDRGHGKAPQHIETENISIMTDAELERQIREFAADMRAMGGRASPPGPTQTSAPSGRTSRRAVFVGRGRGRPPRVAGPLLPFALPWLPSPSGLAWQSAFLQGEAPPWLPPTRQQSNHLAESGRCAATSPSPS